jgi:hypothetical protein
VTSKKNIDLNILSLISVNIRKRLRLRIFREAPNCNGVLFLRKFALFPQEFKWYIHEFSSKWTIMPTEKFELVRISEKYHRVFSVTHFD